ncbi:MAG: hypothetical protein JWN70_1856 [Planctomycetaceae bacterium]|nr:hypothetical protein [Planctomycetaceae bacterium]
MNRHIVLFVAIIVVIVSELCAQETKAKVPPPPAAVDARAKDRSAIRETLGSFAKTFESRDAKKVAAYWTAEGEHQTTHGATVRGREALEKAFSEYFAVTPEVQAELQPSALRFISKDSAIEEGLVTIRHGATESPTHANYTAFLVREEDRWRLAILSETPNRAESISDLNWLVGEWKTTGTGGAEIRTSYSWDANKKFIHAQFSIKEGERAFSGKQVIGVDPATGAIHSWTFEANGGIGEADWSRDGDHWLLDAGGTLPDGRTLKESNILRRVNDDTFTWQSTNRLLDDNEVADLAPVKVTRIKAEIKSEK